MKHLLYTMCALALTSSVYAQNSLTKEDLKVGDNNLEVTFNPFASDSKTFKLNSGALKYRRFFGNNALRVNLGLGVNNDIQTNTVNTKTIPSEYTLIAPSVSQTPTHPTIVDDPATEITKTKNNEIRFKLTAGYERHLDLNRRMSMYFGGEIGYEGSRNTTTTDYSKNGNEKIQTWDYSSQKYYTSKESSTNITQTTETRNNNGYNALVLGAFTGIDFYVYKNLYVGLELGLEFNHRSYLQPGETSYVANTTSTTKQYNSNGTAYTDTRDIYKVERKDGKEVITSITNNYLAKTEATNIDTNYREENISRSSNEFKIDVNPALRLGWRF